MLPLITIVTQAGLLAVNSLTSLLTLLTLMQTFCRSTNIRNVKRFREYNFLKKLLGKFFPENELLKDEDSESNQ